MHQRTNITVIVVFTALTLAVWALFNQPSMEPHWPTRVSGFSFSPYQMHQDAVNGIHPSLSEIEQDLALLAGKTSAVRSYTVAGVLGEIPKLAAKYKINVALGGWLDTRLDFNDAEIERLISIAGTNTNIVRVILGNETLLRENIDEAKLITYLQYAQLHIDQPISTAEPWHVWLKHKELAKHVDYLAVHMLPYWEGIDIDSALSHIDSAMQELKTAFPNKPIVITEVGWPSNGRMRENAAATLTNQALFLRRFLQHAEQQDYVYYLMEAFDQPWKKQTEGSVGAYWGVYDVERNSKFTFDEPIVRIPQWPLLAIASVLLASLALRFLFKDSQTLRRRGRGFLAIIAFASATISVWVIYDFTQQYFSFSALLVGLLLFISMLGLIVVLLAEAHEWAEAYWVTNRRRPLQLYNYSQYQPKVSIHVPAYNEPPEMLIATLNALAKLDYPDFEVLVIDNNTKDANVWQPVKNHCERLGERFRFFHVDPLPGFKAGALNFALTRTATDARVIAVIDSDYQVSANWLKELVPQFENPNIAIIQAPQDYRDAGESIFKSMCYAEYRGFFQLGMVTRNERNAIIQHGTMTLVRRDVLNDMRWPEWCITEDAELGLRIFAAGHEALYIPKSYGRGLMPDTFLDYKKQRHRWAYGAVQILRQHKKLLISTSAGKKLTAGQQYHFLAGWLPWIADGINLIFNIAAIGWTLGMLLAPHHFDPPAIAFVLLPVILFTFKLTKLFHLYRSSIGATLRQTVAAGLAGLALSHTVATAVLSGFTNTDLPFFRTPKNANNPGISSVLLTVSGETMLLLAFLACALVTSFAELNPSLELNVWITLLWVQAIPYFASVIVAFISLCPKLPAKLLGEISDFNFHQQSR